MNLNHVIIDQYPFSQFLFEYEKNLKKSCTIDESHFFNKHDIFYQKQYGFRDHRSKEHAILDIVNKIQENVNKGKFSCGAFIDLQKGFDTADHYILQQKLNHYGVRGIISDWFHSYLIGRTQSTQTGSHVYKKEKPYLECLRALSWDLYCSSFILMT